MTQKAPILFRTFWLEGHPTLGVSVAHRVEFIHFSEIGKVVKNDNYITETHIFLN